MAEDSERDDGAGREDPVERVLRAEQEAQRAVEQCRERAAAMQEAARQRAREISQRADQRIGVIRSRCAERTRACLERLRREGEARAHAGLGEQDWARMERAATCLAARLTGAGDGDEPG